MNRPAVATLLHLLLATGVVLGSTPLAAQAPDPLRYGPPHLRDQFLPSMGFLAFEPASAILLDPGHWQLELSFSASNTFAQSDNIEDALEARSERHPLDLEELRSFPVAPGDRGVFHIDEETYYAMVRARRRFGSRYQASVTVPIVAFGGGRLDGLIEDFHKASGNDQEGRLAIPRDLARIYLRSGEREIYRDRDSGAELGDVAFTLTRRLGEERPRNAWALQAELKLPTGATHSFSGSGSPDVGLRLLHTRRYARWRFDGGLGLIHLGEHELLGLGDQEIGSAFAGIERRFGRSTTGFLLASLTETPFTELALDEIARDSVGWVLGGKRLVGRRAILVVALSENVASYDNSPDVGFHVGLSYDLE